MDSRRRDMWPAMRYTSSSPEPGGGSPEDSASGTMLLSGMVSIQSSTPNFRLSANDSVTSNWLYEICSGPTDSGCDSAFFFLNGHMALFTAQADASVHAAPRPLPTAPRPRLYRHRPTQLELPPT